MQGTLVRSIQAGIQAELRGLERFTRYPAHVRLPQPSRGMKAQSGYILAQLHKGIAGSGALVNYAIWQNVESFRRAFTSPKFQSRITNYPNSAAARPHPSESWRYQITALRDVRHGGQKP